MMARLQTRTREDDDQGFEEDIDNGADFDVVVPSEAEPLLPTPSKTVLEAESNAEGDAQLVPVAKPKAKLDRTSCYHSCT